MLNITDAAAQRILEAVPQDVEEEVLLRIAAARQQDGSIEYGMGWDEQREGDELHEANGVSLLVGSPSRELLEGMSIDWTDIGGGDFCFVFLPARPEGTGSACGGGGAGDGASGGAGGCGGCGGRSCA